MELNINDLEETDSVKVDEIVREVVDLSKLPKEFKRTQSLMPAFSGSNNSI